MHDLMQGLPESRNTRPSEARVFGGEILGDYGDLGARLRRSFN
jgi:hypothetical protein